MRGLEFAIRSASVNNVRITSSFIFDVAENSFQASLDDSLHQPLSYPDMCKFTVLHRVHLLSLSLPTKFVPL